MDLGTIGLIMIAIGMAGVVLIRIIHYIHNKDVDMSAILDDQTRLHQLINISGGGSLAQIIRLYNIRGRQIKLCKDRKHFESYLRDRILLSKEICHLTSIAAENKSSLLISHDCQ